MSVPRSTPAERKAMPIASGVLDYFPDALLVVAEVSRVGNEQHNPGQPLHWAKEKSTDEADALMRHLLDRGTLDTDGLRHSGKVAWRALALLQRELDAEAILARASLRAGDEDPNRHAQCHYIGGGDVAAHHHDTTGGACALTYTGGEDLTVELNLRGELPPEWT